MGVGPDGSVSVSMLQGALRRYPPDWGRAQALASGDGNGPAYWAGCFNHAAGLAMAANGTVQVAARGNHRLKISPSGMESALAYARTANPK